MDSDVIVWLIVRHKNETFLMFLQEVSLKSHRSIINYPFGEFMSRKAGIIVEKCLLFQLNKVHGLVSWCPLHGHLETMYWASREHVLGTGCPHHGHRVPNVWDCFWALYLQAALQLCIGAKCCFCDTFVVLLLCFNDTFCDTLCCFYDTSMILYVKLSEKSHLRQHVDY